jgi:hypothetical protein
MRNYQEKFIFTIGSTLPKSDLYEKINNLIHILIYLK